MNKDMFSSNFGVEITIPESVKPLILTEDKKLSIICHIASFDPVLAKDLVGLIKVNENGH